MKVHCTACNNELNDFESTRKYTTGENIDLCNNCYSFIAEDVDSDVRYDLMSEADNVEVPRTEQDYWNLGLEVDFNTDME